MYVFTTNNDFRTYLILPCYYLTNMQFFPPPPLFFDEISLQNSLKYFYVISINPLQYTFYRLENEI